MKFTLNHRHLNNRSMSLSTTYLYNNNHEGGLKRYDRQGDPLIGHYYSTVLLAEAYVYAKDINEKK